MGRWITTALLCAVSMIGSALIGSQGFGPDPVPDKAAVAAECGSLADDHAQQDCLDQMN